MVANVETMFSGERIVPWHGIGTVVDGLLTAEDALEAAGLNWTVSLEDLYAKVGPNRLTDTVLAEDKKAVVRSSDKSVLGVVGNRYEVVQNVDIFEFLDNLVDDGSAKYTTAGSLAGGRKVFINAKIDRAIKIGGEDAVDLNLVAATSHDGSGAVQAMVTPVRVVCQNTLNLAIRSAKQEWKMRHTTNIEGRIDEARKALNLTFAYADAFESEMNALVEQDFTLAQFEQLVKDVFPAKENKDGQGKRSSEQTGLIKAFEYSPTLSDAIRHTKWGALNAVAEYDDHFRTRRVHQGKTALENRAHAALLGGNVDNRNETLKYLLTV